MKSIIVVSCANNENFISFLREEFALEYWRAKEICNSLPYRMGWMVPVYVDYLSEKLNGIAKIEIISMHW